MTKKELRSEILKKRDLIPPEVREVKNRLIRERFLGLDEYRTADTVMLFASFRTEVDTFEIITTALGDGKRVVLPRVDRETKVLRLYLINNISDLEKGYMGISEPKPVADREVNAEDLDLIMLPGVAFDDRGGRLGYGGGYYDRLIGGIINRPPLIAVAYEEQIVEEVPTAEHDIKVDMIVTDRRVIKITEKI